MAYDFASYLARIDPSQSYVVTQLTGGVVNFTVRASKSGSQHHAGGRFPEDDSLILKQAPPYIAGVGTSAPFSQFRQTIEARALSLFLPHVHLLDSICTQSSVVVPKLLLHDETEHVLVLSDLGKLPNLSDVFSSLGGYVPTTLPAPSAISDIVLQRPLPYYVTIGEKIGSFLARLHSSTSLAKVVHSPSRGEFFLQNPKAKDVVHAFAIKPIKALLDLFPNILDNARSEVLFRWIEDDFLRQTQGDELALALGDCWTGAILVGMDENDPAVGAIDWEFACLGRGVNGDISQLLGHLNLFKLVAEYRKEEVLLQRVAALTESLVGTYRRQSIREGAIWMPTPATHLSAFQAKVMRSAFLACGSEMINSAFWKVWACDDEACGHPHPTEAQNCRLIQHMAETAVWYLDRAGDGVTEFADMESRGTFAGENIMVSLFRGD